MDLGLEGRACAVTGASSGIGRATAVSLARERAAVLLVGRREQPLAEVADECRRAGGRVETLALDVTAADAGERVVEALLGNFERVDVLVNNAGTSAIRTLDQLTDEDWQTQWDLNVIGPMRLMRAAAPEMAGRGWGRIVNVCSSSGKRPSSTNMAYSVAKAAELSLSRAFADLYAAKGVLVNAVAPGPVQTDLWMAPGGHGRPGRAGAGQDPRGGAGGDRGAQPAGPLRHRGGDRRGDHLPLLGSPPRTSRAPRGRPTAAPCP